MKKMLTVLALITVLASTACEFSTPYGDCIGALDEKDPNVTYRTSGRNIATSAISFLIPPVGIVTGAVVLVTASQCPSGRKAPVTSSLSVPVTTDAGTNDGGSN